MLVVVVVVVDWKCVDGFLRELFLGWCGGSVGRFVLVGNLRELWLVGGLVGWLVR